MTAPSLPVVEGGEPIENMGVAFGPGSAPSGQAAARLVGSAGTIPNADELQAVYDLIIVLCEHDPLWRVRGAQALRTINRLADGVTRLTCALLAARSIAEEARVEWDEAPSGMKAGKLLIALSGVLPRYRADIDEIHATLASAMSAGTAETLQAAQGDSPPARPEGDAQTLGAQS